MSYTAQDRTDIVALTVAVWGAAPGLSNLNELATHFQAGGTIEELAHSLTDTDTFRSMYPAHQTNSEFVTSFVDNVLQGRVPADDRQWAIDTLTAEMNAGATKAQVIIAATTALLAVDPADPVWGDAATAFNNKVMVAEYHSATLGLDASSISGLQAVVANVDETQASVDAAMAALDSDTGVSGEVFMLTVGQDIMTGTSADDVFIADMAQNSSGYQVNTFGSGDNLNGGAGTDTLEAQVAEGVFAGGGNQPIFARTTSVENVFFNALISHIGNNNADSVYVRADNMTSLEQVWSSGSDASLTIQNLTTRTDAGDLRLPSEVAIGMSYTGNNDTQWDESNYHVFFAQNNLLADVETESPPSVANYWLLDQDAADANQAPLENIDRDGIRFTLEGVEYVVRPDEEALLDAGTWEAYAEGIEAELAAMVAGGMEALAGISVTLDYNNIRQTFTDQGDLVSIPAITLSDSNAGVFSNLGFTIPQDLSGDFNVFGRTDTIFIAPTSEEFVTSTVFLEKAGRGGEGGELVVGGMHGENKLDNVWANIQGIERFNVNVLGDEMESSNISSLRSTNNQLQIVNVASVGDSSAHLNIGNGNYAGPGLKDVRVINTSEFNGNFSATAAITSESIAKYFELTDTQGDASGDNLPFNYMLTGDGDQSLSLTVSGNVAAHEDFELYINGGSGDDTIVLSVVGGPSNWYANQSELDNITINTGAGDDVVMTPGSGDVIINTGAGNDTVYTDNTGNQGGLNAHWVTNAVNNNVNDLIGAGTGDSFFLFGSTLTVTFSGASAAGGGVGAGAAGAGTNGFEATVSIPTSNGYLGNHTHINQAIKDAINNDDVLSKLLVASDGPNNSVIIASLIDGVFTDGDLLIGINGPAAAPINALNAAETANLNNAYRAFEGDSSLPAFADGAAAAAYIAGQATAASGAYQGVDGSLLAGIGGNYTPAIPGTPGVPGVPGDDQEVVVDFSGLTDVDDDGDIFVTITIDGVDYVATVPVVGGQDADDIAGLVAALDEDDFVNIDGDTIEDDFGPGVITSTQVGETVEFTFAQALGDATVAISDDGDVTFDDTVVQGEIQTIDFTDVVITANGNIVVGGVAVAVTMAMDPDDIALAVVAALTAAGDLTSPPTTGGITATVDPLDDNVVIVEFDDTDGNVADITVVPASATFDGAAEVDTIQAYNAGGETITIDDVETDVTVEFVADIPAIPAVPTIPAVGTPVQGGVSTAETDNTINLGTGQDVVVLSTSEAANETLVWTGLGNGHNTIVNFSDTGASIDMLDFTYYLTSQVSPGGSSASTSMVDVELYTGGPITANNVVVITPATGWATVESTLLATLNGANWSAGNTANLVGSTQKAVVMVENSANEGEYKIFEVSMGNPATTASDAFTSVNLIGIADFGDSLAGLSDANLVGSA